MEGTFHSFRHYLKKHPCDLIITQEKVQLRPKNGLDYFIKLLIDMRNKLA
jgi:hypothetical protein